MTIKREPFVELLQLCGSFLVSGVKKFHTISLVIPSFQVFSFLKFQLSVFSQLWSCCQRYVDRNGLFLLLTFSNLVKLGHRNLTFLLKFEKYKNKNWSVRFYNNSKCYKTLWITGNKSTWKVNFYHFNVFQLSEAGHGKGMRYLLGELLSTYGLIERFDIQFDTLVRFADQLEFGYNLHDNPYHNSLHACDVLQTTHYLIHISGISNWLSGLTNYHIH